MRLEVNNWRSAYSEQRTQLEHAKLQLATAEQSLRYEKTANQAAEKSLEEGYNTTRDIITFLDTLPFPRLPSNTSENVSIGTLWADSRASRHKGRS